MSWMTTILRLAIPTLCLVAIQSAVAAEPPRRQSAPADAPDVLLREYLQALDHLDLDAAKSIAKRAAEQSPGPITELMIRHTRLLGAGKSDTPAKAQARRQPHGGRKDAYYTVTYNVADLVVPPQKLVLDRTSSSEAKKRAAPATPDFDSLIELITGTIASTTWEDVGGQGSIRPFEANLSIVVTQTQEVHKEITSLLEQLRRLQDVTVMLETRVVVVPGDVVPEGNREKIDERSNAPGPFGQSGVQPTTLDAQQLRRLVDAATKNGSVTSLRRVTTLNGQMASISQPAENGVTHWVDIQSIISNDRRRVRLTLVLDQQQTVSGSVNDGKTLLVDLPPLDDKLQNGGQRPADAKASSTRRLLLVTPRIVIAEEEEERLGVELPVRK
jgi:hypothetical protein